MSAVTITKDFAGFFVAIFFVRIGAAQVFGSDLPLAQALTESLLAALLIAIGRAFIHRKFS